MHRRPRSANPKRLLLPDPARTPEPAATPYYVALGDSMSIDLYPTLDLRGVGIGEIPEEIEPIGAASLLYRNDDGLWPEFDGIDLIRRAPDPPGLRFMNAALDGATIPLVGGLEFTGLEGVPGDDVELVTLTVGGNDLLLLALSGRGEGDLARGVATLARAYEDLVRRIRRRFPEALLILATIYDPTDGTGVLPGVSDPLHRLPVHFLEPMNDAIRDVADVMDDVLLADVHAHFLGHGIEAQKDDCWYWSDNMIEPNARGASEIRRVWLEVLRHA